MDQRDRESVKYAFQGISYDINATYDTILENITADILINRYLDQNPQVTNTLEDDGIIDREELA